MDRRTILWRLQRADGIKIVLAALISRGAMRRIGGSEQLRDLSVFIQVAGKRHRILAFYDHPNGRKTFAISFVDFRRTVASSTLEAVARRLSVPGMIPAMNHAIDSDFRSKRKSEIHEVLAYPDKVSSIMEGLLILLEVNTPADQSTQ